MYTSTDCVYVHIRLHYGFMIIQIIKVQFCCRLISNSRRYRTCQKRYSIGSTQIKQVQRDIYHSCWWFRNPKQPPGVLKTLKIMRWTTNLNWWVYRISEPSTVFKLRKRYPFFDIATSGKVATEWLPRRRDLRRVRSGHLLPKIPKKFPVGLYQKRIIILELQICTSPIWKAH